jgi:polyferredoxin
MLLPNKFYAGPWKWLSLALVLAIGVGGFFYPPLGLSVIGLMLVAILLNHKSTRLFCSNVCPNGRSLSFSLKPISRGKKIPKFLVAKEFRRGVCGIMMFCVISLFARSGSENPLAYSVGRVFWSIYVASIGISVVAGVLFKPRAWCAFCPMGTLQDTIASHPSS